MIEIELDGAALQKAAQDLGASIDQIPYALARTLNDAANDTRSFLIGTTWPSAVQVRNQSFMKASLTTKDARATKDDLSVTIYDKLGRGNLSLHARGGERLARGSVLAIGVTGAVTRSARGVPQSQRPRNLKNTFRKGDVLYQRLPGGKLKLVYVLKPQAKIKKDVQFYRDFQRVMNERVKANLAKNVALAMRTRRK